MFLFLILFFIFFVVCIVFLIYKIKLLEDEIDDLYNTCYTYIGKDFNLKGCEF